MDHDRDSEAGLRASLDRVEADGAYRLALGGDLQLDDAADLYARLRRLAADSKVRSLEVDFGQVGALDSAGAVATTVGSQLFARAGKRWQLTGLSQQHAAAIALATEERKPAHEPAAPSFADKLAAKLAKAGALVHVAELVVDTATSGLRALARVDRRRLSGMAQQTVVLGVDAWFIVGLLSFLIGIILAFQGAFQLRKFGADVYMAELVSLGMVREFASVITAIILAGRSGAAIAAELGTMAVNEEIDALRSMGISPAEYLVFPRVAGLTIAQPLLTLMSMAIGIGAGISTGGIVGVPPSVAFSRMQDALVLDDFMLGLLKSLLFSWIIGFTGCFMGLSTRGGASSVGRNTTAAVVLSIFFIVVTDSIVTTAWTVTRVDPRT